jgi:hypothetical protein
MPYSSLDQVLSALLSTTISDQVRALLAEIGDYPDVGLDAPFGPFNLFWHAFGDNPSNLSTIGLATRAGRSITERLTNSMDALLEERAVSSLPLPHSPRQAAKQWFDRPMSGPSNGLFRWTFSETGQDRRIHVVICPSGVETAPTIDAIDNGVGILPEEFSRTILSLQAGNKISCWHLIGSFGQGGASTLAFCDYALIVSRRKGEPHRIGFTLIRVLNLSESYKEDSYAYLVQQLPDGRKQIPTVHTADVPLTFYERLDSIDLPQLTHGTLVRHYTYKLPKLDGSLAPSPGNLYHYLHCSLFDPLFPFRLIDIRDREKARDELVTGSRNRLMRLTELAGKGAGRDEVGSEVRHHRPMEYLVPYGTGDASIGVEYWVVLNYRRGREKRDAVVLRSHSNELFVQTGYPIVGTLNGQNQGELSAALLRDIGLGMVARHLIVHIDASNANSRVRRELFSTNREGFKEGPILTDLIRVLVNMLQEDEALYAMERELAEKLAKREAATTSDEVKRQVRKLLVDAGFTVQEEGKTYVPGSGETQTVREIKRGRHRILDPLPTLPFPGVTKCNIVAPRPTLRIRINDNEVVLVETDADAEFDRRGLVAIRTEPESLEQAAKAPLRGGRVRWRLRPRPTAKIGDSGKVVVTITRPDGYQLKDEIDFEVLPAIEETAKEEKGYVPPFEIIPVNPDDYAELWGTVWPDLSDERVTPEDQARVAYRAVRMGGGINVYYSTIFGPFKEISEGLKTKSATLSELFVTNYAVWIGYHAILQESSRTASKEDISEETLERLLEADRIRVARMQVKQALRAAELMERLLKDRAAEQ